MRTRRLARTFGLPEEGVNFLGYAIGLCHSLLTSRSNIVRTHQLLLAKA